MLCLGDSVLACSGLLSRPVSEDSGSFLEALFACSPDAIVVVDEQGLIEMASAAVETLFGYGDGQVVGKPVDLLVPDQVREVHRTYRAVYIEGPGVPPDGWRVGVAWAAARRQRVSCRCQFDAPDVRGAGPDGRVRS